MLLLKAKTSPGMFPDERTFTFTDDLGNEIAAIVPGNILKGVAEGLLPVRLASCDETTCVIYVPGDVYGIGGSMTRVQRSQLVEQPVAV